MKILVIAEMRSRASLFMDMLSSHLGIKNLEAPYGILHNKAKDVEQWKKTIRSITNVIQRNENFIAKIETTEMFLNGEYIGLECFSPEKYDVIYTIKRDNLADTFCSLYIVNLLNKWQHKQGEEVLELTPISAYDTELLNLIRILKETYNTAIEYLNTHGLEYTELEYNDVINWLKKNNINGTTNLVSPNYNFKTIFTNYTDIEKLCQR